MKKISLIIQEALGPDETGVDRVQEPVTIGIPLPDDAHLREISELGLEGARRGQFRVLGRWPSGNLKWVLLDTLADVKAGEPNTSIALKGGKGNFGGPNLAIDEGENIRINTGPGEFIIRKKNFNLFDQVYVNGRQVVSSGSSKGLLLRGPAYPDIVCVRPCATIYASANDADSQVIIEENGPVKAVIKATGYLRDTEGNAYLAFTARLFFFYGKSFAKLKAYLRNAETPSSTFATAFKEFRSHEIELTPSLGPIRYFSLASHNGITSGSFLSEESVFLYQSYSDYKEDSSWDIKQVRSYIPRTEAYPYRYSQEGYVIQRGSDLLAFGSQSQHPEGWGDLYDASGLGVQIGVWHLPGYWPKSLEFNNGGKEIKIGIRPQQNIISHWQAYPQYSISELFFNFHDTHLSSPGQDFKRFQNFLIGRVASPEYYNKTGALPYPLLTIEEEDSFYKETIKIAKALGLTTPLPPVPARSNIDYKIHRMYGWHDQRGSNQIELRFEHLMKWLRWGTPGQYLAAKTFYNYQEEQAIPRADGFNWQEQNPSMWNYKGYPQRSISLNSDKANIFRPNQDHAHWWGMIFYYFLSGDEGSKEAILDHKARFNNPRTQENRIGAGSSRGLGNILLSQAIMHEFLAAIGDPEAKLNLEIGDQHIARSLLSELEVSGVGPKGGVGVSKTRGLHWLYGLDVGGSRIAQASHLGILLNGLYQFYRIRKEETPRAQEIRDAVNGMACWWLEEAFVNSPNILTVGTSLSVQLDMPSTIQGTTSSNLAVLAWWGYHQTGNRKFLDYYIKQLARNLYSNFLLEQTASFVSLPAQALFHPRTLPPPDPITDLVATKNPDHTVTLTWTAPAGAERYEVKFSNRKIALGLGFDLKQNVFALDPNQYVPWFGAPTLPYQAQPGEKQSLMVKPDIESDLYFAVRSLNAENTISPLSNLAAIPTKNAPKQKKANINMARLWPKEP